MLFFHALILTLVFRTQLKILLITHNLKLKFARSLLLLATISSLFMGLNYIQLADSIAVKVIGPFFVTALFIPLLKNLLSPDAGY